MSQMYVKCHTRVLISLNFLFLYMHLRRLKRLKRLRRLRCMYDISLILKLLTFFTPSDKCLCKQGIEDTKHFLLQCPFYATHRETLVTTVNRILRKNDINVIDDYPCMVILL